MVYEYCEEIQKSGINRNAFPSSCGSFLEMGLYIQLEATNAVNAIFQEAGIEELNIYTESVITEATAKEVAKKVVGAVTNALAKAWEGIKAAWEKIVNAVKSKIDEYRQNLGKKFEELDLTKYKTVLDKVFNGSQNYIGANLDEIYKLEMKLDSKKDYTSGDIDSWIENPYGSLISYAVGASVNNLEEAKKAVDGYIAKKEEKLTADVVIKNKAEIAKALTSYSVDLVNKSYKMAKKSVDKAMKELKALEKKGSESEGNDARGIDLKDYARAIINAELAYQNIMLHLADVRKKAYTQDIVIAGKAVHACVPGKEDKVVGESGLVYNEEYIDSVFAW